MKNKVFMIFKKELREVFRDRKSLMMMFIIPIMIPLLIIGMSALFDFQMNQDTSSYNHIGFAYEVNSEEENLIQMMGIDAVFGTEDDLKEQFRKKEIPLYITKEDNHYTLNFDSASDEGSYTSVMAEEYLNQYRLLLQEKLLVQNDVDPASVLSVITFDENYVGQDNFYATYIVGYSFLFILMAITVSATYPATDTTAGEKERGTMETLLTFPIKGRDIVLGKLCSVTLSSIITGLLSLVLALISFQVANGQFQIYETTPISINALSILVTILVIVIYSLLISGLCIAIASMSKSFKEAQSALTPLTFISFFPGMIAFMIQIETNSLLSIVPFLNYSLILNDVSNGIIHFGNIFLMVLSTLVYIGMITWYIVKEYASEKILFTN